MRRKIKRSKKIDDFVKDDESQQYDQVEKNNEVPKNDAFTEEEHASENKAFPVDEDSPEDRYSQASHDDFAAEEHEWKQTYDEVMDLAVKKNPSLKEIIEQAKAREHVESL